MQVVFESIVGKGENAGKQRFLLFSQSFSTRTISFSHILLSVNALNFDLSFGKGLKNQKHCNKMDIMDDFSLLLKCVKCNFDLSSYFQKYKIREDKSANCVWRNGKNHK